MSFNEAERKLKEYRSKKEREELINNLSEMRHMFTIFFKREQRHDENEEERDSTRNLLDSPIQDPNREIDTSEDNVSDIEEPVPLTVFDYIWYSLWFILWMTLFYIFIKLQFGTVYFTVSCLIGIYLNTRTKPKKKNEISAYSVFNKNCESIDGTLDAEKLTREVIYGGFSR